MLMKKGYGRIKLQFLGLTNKFDMKYQKWIKFKYQVLSKMQVFGFGPETGLQYNHLGSRYSSSGVNLYGYINLKEIKINNFVYLRR